MAKKKDRALTEDEIKAKLRLDLETQWINSTPKVGVYGVQDSKIYILKPEIEPLFLMILAADPADFAIDATVHAFKSWEKRYYGLRWSAFWLIENKYPFLKNPKIFEKFPYPIFLEAKPDLNKLLRKDGTAVLSTHFHGTWTHHKLSEPLAQILSKVEYDLQIALRKNDEGLPLPEISDPEIQGHQNGNVIYPKDLLLEGDWKTLPEWVETADPKASLKLQMNGKLLRLTSSLTVKAFDSCKVRITLNGERIPDHSLGAQVKTTEEFTSEFSIHRGAGVYNLIQAQESIQGEVRLEFLTAEHNPVIIHDIRVGT